MKVEIAFWSDCLQTGSSQATSPIPFQSLEIHQLLFGFFQAGNGGVGSTAASPVFLSPSSSSSSSAPTTSTPSPPLTLSLGAWQIAEEDLPIYVGSAAGFLLLLALVLAVTTWRMCRCVAAPQQGQQQGAAAAAAAAGKRKKQGGE